VTNMGAMFSGANLSTANYDNLLLGWSGRTLKTGVPFSAGSSKYAMGPASTARQSMISGFGWTITDGGPIYGVTPPTLPSGYGLYDSNGNLIVDSTTNPTLQIRHSSGNLNFSEFTIYYSVNLSNVSFDIDAHRTVISGLGAVYGVNATHVLYVVNNT
jgi:hypothetical protein